MQCDTNTTGHFQWFNFKVKNIDKMVVKFKICNFSKRNMMYRSGLRPYYKSVKKGMRNYQQIKE